MLLLSQVKCWVRMKTSWFGQPWIKLPMYCEDQTWKPEQIGICFFFCLTMAQWENICFHAEDPRFSLWNPQSKGFNNRQQEKPSPETLENYCQSELIILILIDKQQNEYKSLSCGCLCVECHKKMKLNWRVLKRSLHLWLHAQTRVCGSIQG